MIKNGLLKEYLKLIIENDVGFFQTVEPEPKWNPIYQPNFTIKRDFPWKPTVEQLKKLKLVPEDLEDGLLNGEHELDIEVDTTFNPSTFHGSSTQPEDPDEFKINGWDIIELDGIRLGLEDANRLKAIIGELTEDEERELAENAKENYLDRDYS